eukprot:CAMPEP_0177695870 /NCGR_PEP_ID=MMETSP0484_2-20121128/3686_1 /TAXON_ID=354590 /ORGANISM="Rhodomonas lens, Strain RHODO" /LENGTH=171 /DNA_ID=CAMNT_0019206821 /DNA_START=188 /DNA_END=703 /DNA_ORIENTATION=-
MPLSKEEIQQTVANNNHCRGEIGRLNLIGKLDAYAEGDYEVLMSCIAEEAQQQPIHGQQAVTFVYLNSNGIDDSKAARVAEALPQLTHLKMLQLEENPFGAAGAAAVMTGAARLTELAFLWMSVDPNKVEWAAMGVDMPAEAMAAATKSDTEGVDSWNWAPMVQKLRAVKA